MNIPVVALKGLTIFPGMVIHFDLNRKPSIAAVRVAMKSGGKLFAVTQRVMTEEAPGIDGDVHYLERNSSTSFSASAKAVSRSSFTRTLSNLGA